MCWIIQLLYAYVMKFKVTVLLTLAWTQVQNMHNMILNTLFVLFTSGMSSFGHRNLSQPVPKDKRYWPAAET